MLQVLDVAAHNEDFTIEEITFELGVGEVGALVGRSGSGKTTLMKVVAGVKAPDRGRVLVDGREVHRRSRRERQQYLLKEIGMVHQHPRPLPGVKTIEYAASRLMSSGMKPGDAKAQVEPLLLRLGLRRSLDRKASSLSGGEAQRAQLALAISTRPRLILADEPTGSLDSATSESVLSLIRELVRENGTTVFIATHDARVEAFSDKVLRLVDGRLVDQESELLS
jgi:ABC-type lipoprotein export system ATPase subunit